MEDTDDPKPLSAPEEDKSLTVSAAEKARFQAEALDKLREAAVFGAMIVKIDAMENMTAPDKTAADIAGIVGKTCKNAKGFWQMTDRDAFGCFFPEADEKTCAGTAEEIRGQVAGAADATVSIGIAVYPTLDYEKTKILENAEKAIAHGAFFGPGSIVCFDAVSLNISGDTHYQSGNMDAAVAEYERALALDPHNVNVHNSMGVCHGDRGEYDKALDFFNKAIELDPGDVFAIYNAGNIHMQKEDPETALDYFNRALKIEENLFELLFQAGRALYELGRPGEALSHINAAISKTETPGGIAYRYIGDCCLALERPQDAIRAYNTALKLRPDDAHALSTLAHCYENESSNPEIALVYSEKAVEIQPDSGLFHYRLAMMYLNRNRLEEARDHFETAAECGHDDALPYIESTKERIEKSVKQENIAGA